MVITMLKRPFVTYIRRAFPQVMNRVALTPVLAQVSTTAFVRLPSVKWATSQAKVLGRKVSLPMKRPRPSIEGAPS